MAGFSGAPVWPYDDSVSTSLLSALNAAANRLGCCPIRSSVLWLGIIDEEDVRAIVDWICRVAARQQIFYLWRPLVSDPKDDMVAELALAARCEAIVTHNVRGFRPIERLGVRVLAPGDFLSELKGTLE